jgi:hypothetical protein
MPPDFAYAHDCDGEARGYFDGSCGSKLRFLTWIEGAKTTETRQMTIAKPSSTCTGRNRALSGVRSCAGG